MNMNKMNDKRDLLTGTGLLLGFGLWTLLIQTVDVRPLGQNGTDIGFAALNLRFHRLTGVHLALYTVTDWLGLVPILICLCFGALGFLQLLRRRSLARLDADLLLLGVYYALVILAYLFFEAVPINYRPVPINGVMEASYPSSTTLLVLSVMPTLTFQLDRRSENAALRTVTKAFSALFSVFMVLGRLVSGVHWVTDIVGSALLSAGLFLLYRFAVRFAERRRHGIS